MAEDMRGTIRGELIEADRKKLLNRKLCRLLGPKNAINVLHELKPGCIYKVEDNEGQFVAEVEFNGAVLGKGEAPTKDRAKLLAAENAVQDIIIKSIVRFSSGDTEETNEEDEDEKYENLPWVTIASFAIHELFHNWKKIGDEPPRNLPNDDNVDDAVAAAVVENRREPRQLPRDALDRHPVMVLNIMHRGLTPVELERTENPCRVTIGYEINGQMYTGFGVNKKHARKEAAKTALRELYGLVYP